MRLVYHPRYTEHRQAGPHPECPERLEAIVAGLRAGGLWSDVHDPAPAELETVLKVHEPEYLRRLAEFGEGIWDSDTYVRPETLDLALLAAGGATLAAELAWCECSSAMALVRPPGHHARASHAMGFCYLNNVAIAAEYLLADDRAAPRARRPAIVDIDVHHGNGTQEQFEANPHVLFISTHQYPHYPGTGAADEVGTGQGEGTTINLPLPAGSGDGTFDFAFDQVIGPALCRFAPDMLLVSLGTDAHERDPLGDLRLSTTGWLRICRQLDAIAGELCAGRIAYVLEGGYDLDALVDGVVALVAAHRGHSYTPQFTAATDDGAVGREVVAAVARRHRLSGD